MIKKYKIGYTQGTFDLFHVGHLNILTKAKKYCDYLIVGINSNELVNSFKNMYPIIDEKDRLKIIKSLKVVDEVHLVNTLDKVELLKKYKYDIIFIGSDWENSERWIKTVKDLKKYNVYVKFLPYTSGISTSDIKNKIKGK